MTYIYKNRGEMPLFIPTWRSKKLSAKEIPEIAKEYLTKQKN